MIAEDATLFGIIFDGAVLVGGVLFLFGIIVPAAVLLWTAVADRHGPG